MFNTCLSILPQHSLIFPSPTGPGVSHCHSVPFLMVGDTEVLGFSHRCIGILGSLIPFPGKHYWEVEAEEDTEYRIGVAFENTPRHGYLGANNSSWCMRHIITPSR